MRTMEKRFTPSQVAEMLGVKVGTIYAMLSRGEIQAYHVGRRRIFTESQVAMALGSSKTSDTK
jgi:excisionase family DNA binding protein